MAKECPTAADTETISTLSAHSETRAVNVLQIANGYLGSKLYTHLFSALEKHGVENKVYVPCKIWNGNSLQYGEKCYGFSLLYTTRPSDLLLQAEENAA